MSQIRINNDTKNILGLWLEPWGSDHWMRPGEVFTVIAGPDLETAQADESPFEVVVHDQGISVWVNKAGDAEVFDGHGNLADCGHQRPIEILRKWTTDAEQAALRLTDSSTTLREMTQTHIEHLQQALAAAEAAQQMDDPAEPGP